MFFYLAKALWFLLQPSTMIAFLIAYGGILIWTGWARWGRRFVSIGAAVLLIAGLSPLGNALILPLEDRFARTNLDASPAPTGFILLGGADDMLVGLARKAPALNEAGERILETAALARKFPQAKIAFTGGDAGILYKSTSEAVGVAEMLISLGVPRESIILEDKSRDTYENAVNMRAELDALGLLGLDKRWILITSAFHMPRAMGVFRKAGFNVEPWPVDYRTRGRADLWRPFDKVSEGLRRVDAASREWVGLLAYWLAGRSETLFPAPGGATGCDLSRRGNPEASPCRPSS